MLAGPRSCRPTNDSARSWRLPRPTWRQSATVDGCPKRTCHAWADVCRHWKTCLRGCRCRRRLRLQRPRNQIRATHRIPTAYDPILPVSGYAPVRSHTLTPQGSPDVRCCSAVRLLATPIATRLIGPPYSPWLDQLTTHTPRTGYIVT